MVLAIVSEADVDPSLQETKTYPVLGLAVTDVDEAPWVTVCVAVPVIVPPVPAANVNV